MYSQAILIKDFQISLYPEYLLAFISYPCLLKSVLGTFGRLSDCSIEKRKFKRMSKKAEGWGNSGDVLVLCLSSDLIPNSGPIWSHLHA